MALAATLSPSKNAIYTSAELPVAAGRFDLGITEPVRFRMSGPINGSSMSVYTWVTRGMAMSQKIKMNVKLEAPTRLGSWRESTPLISGYAL